MSSVKVTSTLKKPYSTYLENPAIGSLNNGSVNYNPTPSVNYSPTSNGTVSNGSVPQPTISLSPESVSSAQNSSKIQAPTYVSALETNTNPATVQANTVTNLPNVNASEMTNVTYKDAVKTPGNVTADGNTNLYTDGSGNYYSIDAETGMIVHVDENGSPIVPEDEKKEEPKLGYTEWLDLQKTNIAQAYDDALKAAQTQRDRAVHNAGGMYQQALSQYGANAAAMSAMGLTGSGYTKYLDSQALAQKQGAINAANSDYQSALSSANSAKMSAENEIAGLYAQYLQNEEDKAETKRQKEEAQRLNAYNAIIENIGKYSEDDIGRLGKANGLTEEQITELKASRAAYTPPVTSGNGVNAYNVFTDMYNNISDYTNEDIDRLTSAAGIASDSQLVKDLKAKRAEVLRATLDQGYYSKEDLDEMKALGAFGEDEAEAEKLYNEYLGKLTDTTNYDASIDSLYATDENGDFITNEDGSRKLKPYKDAKATLDYLKAQNEILKKASSTEGTSTEGTSTEDGPLKSIIDEFEANINKLYKAKQPNSTIKLKHDNFGEIGENGNEIKVEYNGEGYTLAYNGYSGNIDDLVNGTDIADKTVFMYNGVLCIRHGNKYYQLKEGNMYKTKSYNTIVAAFN